MKSKGFTVAEMLTVIALMSVFYLLVLSASRGFFNLLEVKEALRNVTSALRWAQSQALETNCPVRFEIQNKEIHISKKSEGEWNLIRVLKINPIAVMEMNSRPVFSPLGSVSPTSRIRLQVKIHLYDITVSITGRIRVNRLE